ncbi:hypothetical protein JTE90_003523 [Oedothorax gibbosus]|uniref:Uncharacterized protein n=1 Tax=Oedothorax gibbosus TaxID=931172 RepID=A0AAV6UQQ2_9ARAC|nr:hypothetical protein JTE90_003523 [Oedothorax gibbosus]
MEFALFDSFEIRHTKHKISSHETNSETKTHLKVSELVTPEPLPLRRRGGRPGHSLESHWTIGKRDPRDSRCISDGTVPRDLTGKSSGPSGNRELGQRLRWLWLPG